MNTSALPKIDRRIPKLGVFLISILFYVVIMPLNWVLTKIGLGSVLVKMMNRRQTSAKLAQVFQDYEPTAHDVFVSTFSKSGTNWMMQIAHQIAFRGAGEYAHIHDVICWPDMGAKRSKRIAIPLDDKQVQQASPTGLRVIKTHLSVHYVPYSDKARYLVVIRDPKEIFVSSYFFAGGAAGPLMPKPQVWFDLFLTDKFPMNFGNTWAEHTASYWALKDKPNVCVLLFRDMKKDLPGAIRKVADVLGVQLTEAEMNAVAKKSTFSYMSGIEDKFTPMPKGTLPWGDGLKMMREGKVGNAKELLTSDQQKLIDAHFAQEFDRLGSDFPYRELFALKNVKTDPDTRKDAPNSQASIRSNA
jgi:hypothetical protein